MVPHHIVGVMLFVLLAGFAQGADIARSESFRLEPAKIAAWWTWGDMVKFRLASRSIPEDVGSVRGTVTNVAGEEVAVVSVSARDLSINGWQWRPEAPGFYEVGFSYKNEGAEKHEPLAVGFEVKAPKDVVKTFQRSKQGFAVVPADFVPEGMVGQFGFTYSNGPVELALARRVGFDLVRLLCDWGADFSNPNAGIESVKGHYEWSIFDKKVDLFANAGFLLNAQFCYTPLWASPYPEKTNVNICVVEGTTYAPVEMKDFTRFVEAAVNRYKDRIHLWEIWNEPSVPGGSVFWSDTPENFVKLLKAGYEAVKHVQPEAQVWIGGLGPRSPYHAFYNRILKLGAGGYFEVLSLHGSWNTPAEKFRSIEKANQVASKPAIMGEWHAILQGSTQREPVLAERALSFKMMKDLMYQLKQGVTRTMLFELKNLHEKETLAFARENNVHTHSAGLFRRRPQIEPRHAAVVMANFLNLTGRKAVFSREFVLADDVTALQLDTGRGPVVVFWTEGEPLSIGELSPILAKGAILRDWEGKEIPLNQEVVLEKGKFFFLSPVNTAAVAQALSADRLVSPRRMAAAANTVEKGVLAVGPLFASMSAAANVPDGAWLTEGWKHTALIPADKDEIFSARAAVGASEAGLDLVIEVQDAVHFQNNESQWWNADSVQVAVDCEGTGLAGGNTEVITALGMGGPVLWKILAANPLGDIPGQWSPAGGPVKHGETAVSREGNTTRYQIRLPWSELFPLTYDAGRSLSVSIAVNNSKGGSRAEYLEWGGGITAEKEPSAYGQLRPAK